MKRLNISKYLSIFGFLLPLAHPPALAGDSSSGVIWIVKPGSESLCEPRLDKLEGVEHLKRQLKRKGIDVLGIEKNIDRGILARRPGCSETGGVLRCLLIRKPDLAAAEAMGFHRDQEYCGKPSQTRVH